MTDIVTLFCSATNESTETARAFLNEKRVRFRDVNVSADAAGLDELIKLTGRRVVPVISVGERWMVGFDRSKLSKWLRL